MGKPRSMLVYFDSDVYSHIEAAGRDYRKITVDDRDFLFECTSANRISVYFSDLNALELYLMLEHSPQQLENIAKVARRLCPVRRICKGVKQLWHDDVVYYLRHARGQKVDIRWRVPARLRRRKGDMIDRLIEFARATPQDALVLCRKLQDNRPMFDLFREWKRENEHFAEPARNLPEFMAHTLTVMRDILVKSIWFESGLKSSDELAGGCDDLPIETMQSFRVDVEYWAILMWFSSVGSPDGKDRQPKKIDPGDGCDMEHAILSGFAHVFVSDDKRARERYECLSDPMPESQPKPKCMDLPAFVEMLKRN